MKESGRITNVVDSVLRLRKTVISISENGIKKLTLIWRLWDILRDTAD